MTDQQPTPPPLDLDAIEARANRYYSGLERHEIANDVIVLLAEVHRLRAVLEGKEG